MSMIINSAEMAALAKRRKFEQAQAIRARIDSEVERLKAVDDQPVDELPENLGEVSVDQAHLSYFPRTGEVLSFHHRAENGDILTAEKTDAGHVYQQQRPDGEVTRLFYSNRTGSLTISTEQAKPAVAPAVETGPRSGPSYTVMLDQLRSPETKIQRSWTAKGIPMKAMHTPEAPGPFQSVARGVKFEGPMAEVEISFETGLPHLSPVVPGETQTPNTELIASFNGGSPKSLDRAQQDTLISALYGRFQSEMTSFDAEELQGALEIAMAVRYSGEGASAVAERHAQELNR